MANSSKCDSSADGCSKVPKTVSITKRIKCIEFMCKWVSVCYCSGIEGRAGRLVKFILLTSWFNICMIKIRRGWKNRIPTPFNGAAISPEFLDDTMNAPPLSAWHCSSCAIINILIFFMDTLDQNPQSTFSAHVQNISALSFIIFPHSGHSQWKP